MAGNKASRNLAGLQNAKNSAGNVIALDHP